MIDHLRLVLGRYQYDIVNLRFILFEINININTQICKPIPNYSVERV